METACIEVAIWLTVQRWSTSTDSALVMKHIQGKDFFDNARYPAATLNPISCGSRTTNRSLSTVS
jgi:hypothetical protein